MLLKNWRGNMYYCFIVKLCLFLKKIKHRFVSSHIPDGEYIVMILLSSIQQKKMCDILEKITWIIEVVKDLWFVCCRPAFIGKWEGCCCRHCRCRIRREACQAGFAIDDHLSTANLFCQLRKKLIKVVCSKIKKW